MTALLVLQVIIVVFMIAIILMQQSSSDGFTGGGGGGGGGLMSSRGQANLLTKATNILAAAFLINSLVLAYMATHTQREGSLTDSVISAQEDTEQLFIPQDANEAKIIEEKAPAVPLGE